ncbi:methionine synthase reductase-like [Amblyomma americanum]
MCSDERADSMRFLLLYASQTGQAEAVARRLNITAIEQGFLPDLHCVSTFDREFDIVKENCFVLVTSTTDEGLVPEKARRFLRYLRKAPAGLLNRSKYAVLGLGDTNYNNFCNGARTFDTHFEALGAVRFYETGYADDAVGLEIVIEPWIADLWPALHRILSSPTANPAQIQQCLSEQIMEEKSLTRCSLPLSTELTLPLMKDPLVSVQFDVSETDRISHTDVWQGGQPLPFQESRIICAVLTSAKCLTSSEAVKEAWELEFELPANSRSEVSIKPGDSFGFLCINRLAEVDYVIKRLGVLDSQLVSVTHSKTARNMEHLPKQPLAVRRLLTTCCDVRGIPKKIFLRTLAEYTSDASEKRRLLELSSREGSKDYIHFILEARNTFLDILRAFSSCKPPLIVLLEHLPRLLPRYYSVCNWSPQEDSNIPRRFKILYKRCPIPGSNEEGLCTGWLTELAKKWSAEQDLVSSMTSLSLNEMQWQKVPVYLRKNTTFRFPESLNVPIIMIGPGTGVAPFLSYLQWRREAMSQSDKADISETWLFTGCRHRHLDFLYEDELNQLLKQGALSKLIVSFSRDVECGNATDKSEDADKTEENKASCSSGDAGTDSGSHVNAVNVIRTEDCKTKENDSAVSNWITGGKYVQDSMRLWRHNIAQLISLPSSYVCVCGDAVSMATSVRDTIVEILVNEGTVATKEDGVVFVKELQKQGRYLEDIWTA